MTNADLEIFDFRQNSALDDTAVAIRDWVKKSSSYFSDFWMQVSDFDAQLSTGSTVTQPYRDLLEKTVRENFYCIADIKDQTLSVWYASNRDLRMICNEMLGISDGDEATDDDLTAVEKTLVQLFIDNLAVALGAGWMGADKIEIAPTELVRDPHKAAIIRGTDLAILTPIEVKLRSGAATIQWILPKQKACNLLDTIVDKRKSGQPTKLSAEVLGKLPVEIVIALGKARVPMLSLSNLSPGEIIKLDHRIDQPLTANINGKLLCECWPGKIGDQQAIEISNIQKTMQAVGSDK